VDTSKNLYFVIPVKAGILEDQWISAYAGMTPEGEKRAFRGVQVLGG
jgi:hypothetical protein